MKEPGNGHIYIVLNKHGPTMTVDIRHNSRIIAQGICRDPDASLMLDAINYNLKSLRKKYAKNKVKTNA